MDLYQGIDNVEGFALMTVDQAGDNVVLPTESENTTGMCLHQLNTDCLMEIFSYNSLTLTDLCSIAETCTRFKQIAERIFPKDLSVTHECRDDIEYYLESKKFGKNWCRIEEVERILKNFGQYILVVEISCDELLEPMAKYCGTATLQRLRIGRLHFVQGKGLTRKLKPIFQRTLALSLKHCDLRPLVADPYINDSLIELEITYSSGFVAILRNTFPKLERFTFYGKSTFPVCHDVDFSEILPSFLRRHKRLTSLHLSSESVYCSSQLMETIDNTCTELTNLTLERWGSPKTSFSFSHLKNLRKLSMLAVDLERIDHRQLIAFLEVLKVLTKLKLRNLSGELTQIFIVLPQLPNLRELHLEYGDFVFDQVPWSRLPQLKVLYLRKWSNRLSASHLLQIIRELSNLEELVYSKNYFYTRFMLTSEVFSKIVEIVKQRPNKLTLRCHLSKDLAKNYVPNKNVNLIEYRDYK